MYVETVGIKENITSSRSNMIQKSCDENVLSIAANPHVEQNLPDHSAIGRESEGNTSSSQEIEGSKQDDTAIQRHKCDTCYRFSSPKNAVKVVPESERDTLKECVVDDMSEGHGFRPYPVTPTEREHGYLRQCKACRRLFLKLSKEQKRFLNYKRLKREPLAALLKSIDDLTKRFNRFKHPCNQFSESFPKVCYIEHTSTTKMLDEQGIDLSTYTSGRALIFSPRPMGD